MDFQEEIDIYFRSRFTLIVISSNEEEEIKNDVQQLCERTNRQLYLWDQADYFQKLCGNKPAPQGVKDALSVLETIENSTGKNVYLLRDFHQCWINQPRIVRKLRNLAQKLKLTESTIIVTTPLTQIPEELEDDVVWLDYNLPDYDKLKIILNKILSDNKKYKNNLEEMGQDKLLLAALGLSANQAFRAFSKSIEANCGKLDFPAIDMVNNEKKQIIRKSRALEFFTTAETMDDVGGLEALKEWLRKRKTALEKNIREAYKLDSPKGLLMVGIPGTGKSLTAKTIAALWKLPMLRLDIGALFGGLVGESEANTRRALRLAETISPCILWIDEIEKGLAIGGGDGGTSLRVFGSILSWMQEKTKTVFVVATANKIAALPPELLRAGRFDDTFFIDIPTTQERKHIFKIHLEKRRLSENYNIDILANASEGYVGSEIEQAIINANYNAVSDLSGARDFTTEDVLLAIKELVPLSRSQREAILALRTWLEEGRAKSATWHSKEVAMSSCVRLDWENN